MDSLRHTLEELSSELGVTDPHSGTVVIENKKGVKMAKFYTLGCYTAKGLGGFVSNPSTDRKAATSALAASVGAKVTQYSRPKRKI